MKLRVAATSVALFCFAFARAFAQSLPTDNDQWSARCASLIGSGGVGAPDASGITPDRFEQIARERSSVGQHFVACNLFLAAAAGSSAAGNAKQSQNDLSLARVEQKLGMHTKLSFLEKISRSSEVLDSLSKTSAPANQNEIYALSMMVSGGPAASAPGVYAPAQGGQGAYPPNGVPPGQYSAPPGQHPDPQNPQQTAAYPAAQGQYPAAQGGYPPQQNQYAPQQNQNPPQQNQYPSQQGQYPVAQGQYAPQQAGYPPAQNQYPPQQGQNPAAQSQYAPPQQGYAPQAQNSVAQGQSSSSGFQADPNQSTAIPSRGPLTRQIVEQTIKNTLHPSSNNSGVAHTTLVFHSVQIAKPRVAQFDYGIPDGKTFYPVLVRFTSTMKIQEDSTAPPSYTVHDITQVYQFFKDDFGNWALNISGASENRDIESEHN